MPASAHAFLVSYCPDRRSRHVRRNEHTFYSLMKPSSLWSPGNSLAIPVVKSPGLLLAYGVHCLQQPHRRKLRVEELALGNVALERDGQVGGDCAGVEADLRASRWTGCGSLNVSADGGALLGCCLRCWLALRFTYREAVVAFRLDRETLGELVEGRFAHPV